MDGSEKANGVCLIAGVGDGLGAALAEAFAADGLAVALMARQPDRLERLAARIVASGGRALAVPGDASDESQVTAAFDRAEAECGPLRCAVFNVARFARGSALAMTAAEFEQLWRVMALGGFLFGREAGRRMLPHGAGSILYTGATASLRGGAQFVGFAAAKAALRSVAQSLAREMGPKGLHVAHVVIDGVIDAGGGGSGSGADRLMRPADIAASFVTLHRQPRSAWSFEMDLRPFSEPF